MRIRWYDSHRPGKKFFFEIKWRNNRVTGKHRIPLLVSKCLSQLSYSEILASLENTLPSDYLGDVLAFPDATVLVEYKREHFVSRDEPLRVTLDYDLVYYDQSAKEFMSASFGTPMDDLVVVEGKIPVGRESELVELLYPLSLRAQRCSKYVLGCGALGLMKTYG